MVVKLDTAERKGDTAERREVMEVRKEDMDTVTAMDTHQMMMMTVAYVASQVPEGRGDVPINATVVPVKTMMMMMTTTMEKRSSMMTMTMTTTTTTTTTTTMQRVSACNSTYFPSLMLMYLAVVHRCELQLGSIEGGGGHRVMF